MGRQIRFYLSATMRNAILDEAIRINAPLCTNYTTEQYAIQFSQSSGIDKVQGRLWTETPHPAAYESLCRAVKKMAAFYKDSGLWFKKDSENQFNEYRKRKAEHLERLVCKNRMQILAMNERKETND